MNNRVFLFIGFLSLFTLPLPIRACMTEFASGDVTPHLPGLLPYLPIAVALVAFSLPWFVWGYYSGVAKKLGAKIWRPKTGSHYYRAFLVLIGVSLALVAILAGGDILHFVLLGYGSTAETPGKGYLAIGLPGTSVASMFLLCRYMAYRQRRDLIFFVLISLTLAAFELIMGRRGEVMHMLVTTLIFWHYTIRRLSFKAVAVVGIIAFVFLNEYGMVRSSRYESLSDVVQRSADNFGALRNGGGTAAAAYYTLTGGEFVVPFETFPQMVKSVGPEIFPMLGLTYARTPVFFVPQAIYPGHRPDPLANWYMKEFYGSGWGFNEGRGFYFLSEGYLNFGPAGVLGLMVLWGILLGAVHHYMRNSKGGPGAALLFSLALASIPAGIAGDFSSILVGLPEQYLIAAVLGIWLT